MYWIVMKKLAQYLPIDKWLFAFNRGDCVVEADSAELLVYSDSTPAFPKVKETRLVLIKHITVPFGLAAISREFLSPMSFSDVSNLYVLANLDLLDNARLDTLSMYHVAPIGGNSTGYREINLSELAKQTGLSVKILARHAENMVFQFKDDQWSVAQ